MLKNKKLIIFDLDGTLTESKSPIAESTVILLKELITRSKVAVISGGSFAQFEKQFLPLFLKDESFQRYAGNLMLLPTSGSQRYEYDSTKKGWIKTDEEKMPEMVKNKAVALLRLIIDKSEDYDIPRNPTGDIIEDRSTQITFSALGQLAPIEKKKLWDPDHKKKEKIKAILESQIPEATIAIGGTTTLDILPKGFSKAVGIRRLSDKLAMSVENMIFVGDALFPGGNDFSVTETGMETVAVTGPKETESFIRKLLG